MGQWHRQQGETSLYMGFAMVDMGLSSSVPPPRAGTACMRTLHPEWIPLGPDQNAHRDGGEVVVETKADEQKREGPEFL